MSHFLGHVKKKLAVTIFNLAQQATKSVEIAGILTGAAPSNVVGGLSLQEIRQRRWVLALVEDLVERTFERASKLFQRLDGGNSLTILDAGDITTKQAGPLLDVALGEFLFLTHFAEAFSNNHGALLHPRP